MKFFNSSWGLLRATPLLMMLSFGPASAQEAGGDITGPTRPNQSTYSGRVPVKLDSTIYSDTRPPEYHLRIVGKVDRQIASMGDVAKVIVLFLALPTDKENLRGVPEPAVTHPASSLFIQETAAALDVWFAEHPEVTATYGNPLLVRPDVLSLVAVDLDEDNPDFDLNIQTTISRKPDSTSFFSIFSPPHVTCVDKFADTGLNLAQWKADDYAALRLRAKLHVKNCMPKIQAMFSTMLAD